MAHEDGPAGMYYRPLPACAQVVSRVGDEDTICCDVMSAAALFLVCSWIWPRCAHMSWKLSVFPGLIAHMCVTSFSLLFPVSNLELQPSISQFGNLGVGGKALA